MKIGFTGTRKGMTDKQRQKFVEVIQRFHDADPWNFIFMHGDCIGADADAHHEVAQRAFVHWTTVSIEIFPPIDDSRRKHCAGDLGPVHPPASYDARNKAIVQACDILIAAPDQPEEKVRGGTWRTVRYARTMLKPIVFVYPNGMTAHEKPLL